MLEDIFPGQIEMARRMRADARARLVADPLLVRVHTWPQSLRTSVSTCVETLGGTVRTAYDPLAGLDALAEFGPDVVVLDIGLPGIDGYEMCQRIRLRPSDRPIIVIALIGWGHRQDKQRALDVGFDAHLTKPVDPAAFQELLAISHTNERHAA